MATTRHQRETSPAPKHELNGYARPATTAVPAERLIALNDMLLVRPEGFTPNAKLDRNLQRRRTTIREPGGIASVPRPLGYPNHPKHTFRLWTPQFRPARLNCREGPVKQQG